MFPAFRDLPDDARAWRRWRAASGRRSRWTAAFATVLLAGIVSLLWFGGTEPQAQRAHETDRRNGWTQVRIEADGASKVVPRGQADRLADLLARALAAPSEPALGVNPVALSLEIAEGDEPLGLVEWTGERWRWVPLRDARQGRWLKLGESQSAELLREAQGLLQK